MAYPTSPAPQFVFEEVIGFNTIITKFESGKEERKRKWAQYKHNKVFTLVYNYISASDMQILRNHFLGTGTASEGEGAYLSFSFTNPNDSVAYTVRYAEDGFKLSLVSMEGSNKIYSVQTTLITEQPTT